MLSSDGEWIAAPYIPGSIVVNIGDLMAKVSRGSWATTMHRVRATNSRGERKGRYSMPFFFEPGMDCVIKAVGQDNGVVYSEHVLEKIKGWVEFHDVDVGKRGLECQIGCREFKIFAIARHSPRCYLTLPKMVGTTTSSLIAVIIVTASSIDTSLATESLPLDNTIVSSDAVEEIPVAVVEELLASVVDSLVNLGLVFS